MKQIEGIASEKNFKAINVGPLDEVSQYVLEMGPEVKIPGKVFCGAASGRLAANSLSRCSNRERKPDSSTPIRTMRNCTSSWAARASSK